MSATQTKYSFDKFESPQTICEKLYEWVSPSFRAGMAIKIYGGDYKELSEHSDRTDMFPGFIAAKKLIEEGRIFYVHPFKCSRDNCPLRFRYGGFWACNFCNTHINTPEWWKIKVMQDGNAWVCIGQGFINLQESENYAFGDNKQEAINNYHQLMLNSNQ